MEKQGKPRKTGGNIEIQGKTQENGESIGKQAKTRENMGKPEEKRGKQSETQETC